MLNALLNKTFLSFSLSFFLLLMLLLLIVDSYKTECFFFFYIFQNMLCVKMNLNTLFWPTTACTQGCQL